MKRGIIFFVILFLCPFVSSLYDKTIFSGWVLAGETFNINNETYRANYIKQTNTTIVYFPEGISAVIYANNNTACAYEWLYSVCQTKQKFEKGGKDIPPNAHELNINISLYMTINKTDAGLQIIRNTSSKDFFLGDEIEVTTTLKKTGFLEISNISFIDWYPETFQLESTGACYIKNNAVVWKGDMNKSGNLVCLYKITPKVSERFVSTANISYSLFGKEQRKQDNLTLNVADLPLKLDINASNSTLVSGNVASLSVSIYALTDFNLRELKISFPNELKIINKTPGANEKNNAYVYSQQMIKNDRKVVSFIVNSSYAGTHAVNVSAEYSYNSKIKRIDNILVLNYTPEFFYLNLFRYENTSVLRMTNPGNGVFKKIKVNISGLVYDLPELGAKRYKEFTLPKAEENVTAELSYSTRFGQIISRDISLAYTNSSLDGNGVLPIDIKESSTAKKDEKKLFFVIDKKTAAIAGAVFAFSLLISLVINFFISKNKKSGLDKEIEGIKKADAGNKGK